MMLWLDTWKVPPHEDDTNTILQLTEKIVIKSEHIFHLDNTNKKFDKIIACALTITKAYEPFFNKFNHFALIFHFLTPKKRDIHCSHEVMLTIKLIHTYKCYKFKQKHYITNAPARNPQLCFIFINSKYTSRYLLSFNYCIKSTNLYGILRNYDPVRQMYIFCPLTNTSPIDDSRPIIIIHEYR